MLTVKEIFVCVHVIFFFKCIILVNKRTCTFNQLGHFQDWNSWDVSGRGNCIRLYTTGILNREMSLHALQFCHWVSLPSQGNAKSSALFYVFRSSDFFICFRKTLKPFIWLRFHSPPSTVHWLTFFQEDRVNGFSQSADWSVTMCYWGTSENSSM